jgi:toxin ParE1/3/4
VRSELSPLIKKDLDEIADWIAQDSPLRALKIIRELRAEFRRIAQHPMLYQLRPDIGDDVRLATLGHHVILFWIDGDVVRFERVVYGGRDLPSFYP